MPTDRHSAVNKHLQWQRSLPKKDEHRWGRWKVLDDLESHVVSRGESREGNDITHPAL